MQRFHAAAVLAAVVVAGVQAAPYVAPPAFSLDMVANNLMALQNQVPDEDWNDRLVEHHSGCNCGEQEDDANAEEASAEVADEDFQVAPSTQAFTAQELNVEPNYNLALMQNSAVHRHGTKHRSGSRSGCNCATGKTATAAKKALSLASSATSLATSAMAPTVSEGADEKPTGIWLNTCHYSQRDLTFWRLTNTAFLRGGIVLKETIAYTDTCKMCDYNNVACNKEEVELKDGNCLCMWRMNGVEKQTQLLACSACVTDCIGQYKTFDLGKPDPGMQKGVCLRKKPHKAFGDIKPIP